MLDSGRARHALVIGADLMSRVLDLDDRRTAGLFGDGAGALLMGGSLGPRFGDFAFGVDAAGAGHICVPRARQHGHGTARTRSAPPSSASPRSTPAAAMRAGYTLDEIDLFVVHQANRRILRSVGERLGLDADRVVDCIELFGNTSAATIPLALARRERDGQLVPGLTILLAAFGAGFTVGRRRDRVAGA